MIVGRYDNFLHASCTYPSFGKAQLFRSHEIGFLQIDGRGSDPLTGIAELATRNGEFW